MTRQKWKSLTEAHSYRLPDQVTHLYCAGGYKNACKACTGLLKPAAGDTTSSISVQKAVDRINSELLSFLWDKTLKKSTIHDAIGWGSFGVSPLKNGRRRIVPPKLRMA